MTHYDNGGHLRTTLGVHPALAELHVRVRWRCSCTLQTFPRTTPPTRLPSSQLLPLSPTPQITINRPVTSLVAARCQQRRVVDDTNESTINKRRDESQPRSALNAHMPVRYASAWHQQCMFFVTHDWLHAVPDQDLLLLGPLLYETSLRSVSLVVCPTSL